MHHTNASRSAFSLVELSIVLVILGLLVGGVLSGRALIHAAELRAIPVERDKFAAAINGFRDKYFQLPGDINNAFQFWGATCGTNTTTASTGCNGDGDGLVEYENGETAKLWEHLSRAGLIEGSFDGTGIDSGGGRIDVSTTNAPKSRYPQGYWDLSNEQTNIPSNVTLQNDRMYLTMGGIVPGGTNSNLDIGYITFTRGDAWNVDKKIDDGWANEGKMRGDGSADCSDFGTDYYDIQGSAGYGDANYADCMANFILN